MPISIVGPGAMRFNPARDASVLYHDLFELLQDSLVERRHKEIDVALKAAPTDAQIAEVLQVFVDLRRIMVGNASVKFMEALEASGYYQTDPGARLMATYYFGALYMGSALAGMRTLYSANQQAAAEDLRALTRAAAEYAFCAQLSPWRRWLYRYVPLVRAWWKPVEPSYDPLRNRGL